MTLKAVPVDFDATWKSLGSVCQNVIRRKEVKNDLWYNSFGQVYAICISRPVPLAFKLYDGVTAILKERIMEIKDDIYKINDNDLLSSYSRHWDNFHAGLKDLDRFVNNQYIGPRRSCDADIFFGNSFPTSQAQNMEILQLGLSLWKTILIECLGPRLTSRLLAEVAKDRSGIVSRQDCISPCLESFLRVDELKGLTKIALNVYADLFVKPLIEETRVFYSEWTARARQLPCTDFISEALEFLKSEIERSAKYYPYSREEIMDLFNEIVVHQQLDFLNASVAEFIHSERKDVIRKFYQLLAPTNQCAESVKQFGLHVKAKVNSVLADIPSGRTASSYFVDSLLAVRSHFTQFIDQVFDGTSTYRNEMDKAFSQAINSSSSSSSKPKPIPGSLSFRPSSSSTAASSSTKSTSSSDNISISFRVAQYMNRYLDELLRRPEQQRLTDGELEEKITAAIVLFKYVDEKDLFRQFYQKNLCYRLLFNPTTTLELEESTITKLKDVCGYEFVSKFQRMHSDMQLARTINENFREYLLSSGISVPFSHQCSVLTVSAWPINSKATINFYLPPSFVDYKAHFETFYKKEYSGRNLHWILSACMAESKLLYTDDGRQYTVHLTALHTSTLSLFDYRNVDQMTLGALRLDLLKDSSVDAEGDVIVKQAVKPLVDAGFLKLLTPDGLSGTEEFNNDTIVALNRAYTHRHARVKFIYNPAHLLNSAAAAAAAAAGSKEEVEQVEKEVNADRKFYIMAAIVRILKTRKTIKHAELVKCVMEEAKDSFQPAVLLIKRCIEELIEKSYLERSPDDTEQYNYLA